MDAAPAPRLEGSPGLPLTFAGFLLTRQFAGGVDLSGGEWQKIAPARAFIRDAAFVIPDEPTAALDADAEFRLFEQFRALMTGKTALLISHGFSTVRMADQILVLEDGRIIESGSHAKLLARRTVCRTIRDTGRQIPVSEERPRASGPESMRL